MIEAGNVCVGGWAWGEGKGCGEVKDTEWCCGFGRWWEGKKLFTHCSHSQAPVWKMHGTSVRNTIICMAQRIEAVHATLLDTSTQDAPVQYSWTQHSLVQQEDSQAKRRLQKRTQTCLNKLKERTCASVGLIIYVIVIITIFSIITLM